MADNQMLPLAVQPVISYPREAQMSKTYLMTIDLRLPDQGLAWPYDVEEYLVYCMVDTAPLFTSKPVGEPAVVLHRFGGTYGPAQFLLTPCKEERKGAIRVTLVNQWGIPLRTLNLADIQVTQKASRPQKSSSVAIQSRTTAEQESRLPEQREESTFSPSFSKIYSAQLSPVTRQSEGQLDDLFGRRSIRHALNLWHNPKELGKHELAKLKIVKWQRQEEGYKDTPTGYGQALRAVLRKQIESLKPKGKEPTTIEELNKLPTYQLSNWQRYFILTGQYIADKPRKLVERTWDIPKATYTLREKEACQRLGDILREQERQCPPLPKEREPAPPEPLFVGVPPEPEHFVGREELLLELSKQLIKGENLVLEGLPGVGKTTLAVELANNKELLQYFSDGVLWASLGQKPDVLSVLARWGQALGRDVTHLMNEAERAEAVKDAIGPRRLLLVIDDAWDAKAIKWLRLGGPYSSHLLTTRDKAIAHTVQAQVITVPVLQEKSAFTLLQTLAPEACAADPAKARELVQAVEGLPLALDLLGGYLNAPEHSLFPELAEEAMVEMSDPHRRLQLASQRLGSFTSPEVTLQETIELSLANLPLKTVGAFHALGAFAPKPADFDRQAAEAVTGANARTLAFLMARNLIERTDKRLTLHHTLTDVARTKLDEQASKRHRKYYLTFAQTNAARDPDAWNKLEPELPNLLLAVERAAKAKDLNAMISFEEALIHQGQLLYVRGYYQEAITLLSQSLAVQKEQNQPQYQPRTLNKLAFFYMRLNKEKTAQQHAEAASDLASTLGNQEQQADSLKQLAIILYTRGELEKARQSFEEELKLRQALNSPSDLANCFNSLGLVQLAAGNYPEAKAHFDEVIKRFEKLDNPSRLAMYACNRGLPSLYLGDYSAAMKDFETALEQGHTIGDRYTIARSLLNKGLLHSYLAQYSLALQCLTEALQIYQKIKRQAGEVLTLGMLAEVHSTLGDHQQATRYLQEAGHKIPEIESREIKVDYHNKRGVVGYQQGHYEEAKEAYQKAATLTKGAKTKYYAQIQTKLGLLQTSLAKGSPQDLENARQYAHEAIALCQQMQLAGNEPRAHAYLGKANLLLGDKETALENSREAIRLLQKQQVVHRSEAQIYLHAVHILAANGQTEEEQRHLEHAYRLIQATAAKIEHDTLRQRYLATPINREISETWQRLQANKSTDD